MDVENTLPQSSQDTYQGSGGSQAEKVLLFPFIFLFIGMLFFCGAHFTL